MDQPLSKIYITSRRMVHGALLAFMLTLGALGRLQYSRVAGALLPRRSADALDGIPLVVGVVTLLRQFHTAEREQYLRFMGLYVRLQVEAVPAQKAQDYPQEALNALVFLDDFLFFTGLSRSVVEQHVPSYIISEFRSHAAP